MIHEHDHIKQHCLKVLKDHKQPLNYRYDVAAYLVRNSMKPGLYFSDLVQIGRLDAAELEKIVKELDHLEMSNAIFKRKQLDKKK